MHLTDKTKHTTSLIRLRIFYACIIVTFGVFVVRLFYLQIIHHDTYIKAARSDQLREYEVDADRGTIYAELGGKTVPLVLNTKLNTIYADPVLIKQPGTVAAKLAPLLNVPQATIEELLALKNKRYVILQKRVTPEVSKQVLALKLPGVGSQERNYRTYPQGTLAAQLLGFVNDDGVGNYGVEQALNRVLAGQKGQLRAVTDVHGIPLAANTDNLVKEPVAGSDVTLTIDLGMQTQVEQIIKRAQEKFNSKKVSAIVLETQTGAVKAMANYPTYDPAKYQTVEDGNVFQNAAVTEPIEPGSITKVLNTAAGLDSGAITPESTYYDPGSWTFDGAKVVNVAEGTGSGSQSVRTMLNSSLNTGAVWVLMQMGGGKINDKARQTLYDYYTNHFRIGKATGIEQGYEAVGSIVEPENKDNGITITYANMSFGQAYSATALQMGSALSAIVNGGTYYQPYLVASKRSTDGNMKTTMPKAVQKGVVSQKTSNDMINLLDYVTKQHVSSWPYMKFDDRYVVGGKTGTAEMVNESGTEYRSDVFNGTFMGFVGGDSPQYTIVVYNIQPHGYAGYAGANTGQPLFAEIAHMLIDNYGVTPKKQ